MMQALIHIGMPKTGSSSIQAFLASNRARLEAQGHCYAPFNPAFGSQYELAVAALEAAGDFVKEEFARQELKLKDPHAQSAYVTAWTAHLERTLHASTARQFIASSEHLHAWLRSPSQIGALDTLLRRHFDPVRYLIYLRPQEEFITSSYSEKIRRGATIDFETHFRKQMKHNYWRRLQSWIAVVGRDRLDVALMVSDALQGGNLLTDFCARAGIDPAGLDTAVRVNPSLSLEEIAVRRRLNRWLAVRNGQGKPGMAHAIALRVLGRRLPRPGTRLTLDAEQIAQVRKANTWSNEQIRATFFPERAQLF